VNIIIAKRKIISVNRQIIVGLFIFFCLNLIILKRFESAVLSAGRLIESSIDTCPGFHLKGALVKNPFLLYFYFILFLIISFFRECSFEGKMQYFSENLKKF